MDKNKQQPRNPSQNNPGFVNPSVNPSTQQNPRQPQNPNKPQPQKNPGSSSKW